MKSLICSLLLFSLLLAACGTVPPAPTSTPVPSATSTPAPTQTPSLTPEPTATPVDEYDLRPNYTEAVSREFMGVQINAELITDKSLDPLVRKVTVGERAYAEFIARSIYKVWLKKGGPSGTGPETETTFEEFMALWAAAQGTNDPADWEKVQLQDIWANDLADGNGYVQKPYTIWPMYTGGEAPEGVRGIDNFAIALVNGRKTGNNLIVFPENPYEVGCGTNLDKSTLYVYFSGVGLPTKVSQVYQFADTAWWLVYNSGSASPDYTGSVMSYRKYFIRHFPLGWLKIE